MNSAIIKTNTEYKDWLTEIKQSFLQTQLKAAISVNSTLLEFYWQLGSEIVEKQRSSQWGDGFLSQLSHDLMTEFPDIKGFSKRNLWAIRQWYLFYFDDSAIVQQPVAQLARIPWGHNLVIVNKCPNRAEALFYVKNTLKHGWSRNVLIHQIESGLYQREGKAITNFEQTLPPLQSDLALQSLKDPYVFDFLSLTKDYNERELEHALTQHITQFLLELGAEYALSDINKPIGISEYQLTQALPENLKSSLPSIEEIEAEFAKELGGSDGEKD